MRIECVVIGRADICGLLLRMVFLFSVGTDRLDHQGQYVLCYSIKREIEERIK